MVVPVLLLTLGAAAVLLGSRKRRPHSSANSGQAPASPVAYQHLQLYQGGLLSQSALETTKAEFVEKLSRGGAPAVETCLRSGLEFVVQVRALAEIGTEDACRVLEHQLARRISEDPIEQAWYWVDLVQALRDLNRGESLPTLLRCSEKALSSPLGHLFAAEISAFPQFPEYLHDPLSPAGQASMRVLRSAMEGIRRGFVPVTLYAEGQIGEIVRRLTETCPDTADPLLARLFVEALRHARRSYSNSPELRDDPLRRQAVRWQAGYLRDAEPILREYLHEIGDDLSRMLPRCSPDEQADALAVLAELHADTGEVLIELLREKNFPSRVSAIECLQWSATPEARTLLCDLARSAIAGRPVKVSWWRRHQSMDTVPTQELLAVMQALRGHPGEESEAILGEFARHPQPTFRIAALNSLGWWEPIDRSGILTTLHSARIDENPEVRTAAVGALARLGECASLQVLRDSLTSENVETVHQAIEVIASEGLTWLWPELDMLTEADHPAIAHHAWEAVEGLRESILGPLA